MAGLLFCVIFHLFVRTEIKLASIFQVKLLKRLTTAINEEEGSLHVPALRFIGLKQLVYEFHNIFIMWNFKPIGIFVNSCLNIVYRREDLANNTIRNVYSATLRKKKRWLWAFKQIKVHHLRHFNIIISVVKVWV